MKLVPSDQFSYAELAGLFTRGYEGYFVPMHFDERTLRYMVDAWDIDLSRSRVAPDAGLCNLAIRGDRGWIGGIAVVPEQRRHGVGRLGRGGGQRHRQVVAAPARRDQDRGRWGHRRRSLG